MTEADETGGLSEWLDHLVAVSVGNTRTQIALFGGKEIAARTTAASDDAGACLGAIEEMIRQSEAGEGRRAVVIATVNAPAADAIERSIKSRSDWGVYRIGRDLDVPIEGRLETEAMTGQDRVLAALAAFEIMGQACIVVDAGTALTVDFVDGEGVFHGGAIAPGANAALQAMHAQTDALPELAFEAPEEDAVFGRDTAQAMQMGVFYSARGLVHVLTERYAEAYGAYPVVVATGGDARAIFGDDDLIDRVADDLVLRGIAITCSKALLLGEDGEGGGDGGDR